MPRWTEIEVGSWRRERENSGVDTVDVIFSPFPFAYSPYHTPDELHQSLSSISYDSSASVASFFLSGLVFSIISDQQQLLAHLKELNIVGNGIRLYFLSAMSTTRIVLFSQLRVRQPIRSPHFSLCEYLPSAVVPAQSNSSQLPWRDQKRIRIDSVLIPRMFDINPIAWGILVSKTTIPLKYRPRPSIHSYKPAP